MKLEFFEGLVIAIAHVAERRSDLRPRKPRNGCPLLCAFDCLPSCSSLLLPLVVFEYLSVSSCVGTLGSALAARGAGVGLDAASLLVSRLRKPARVKGLKGRGGWLLTSSAPPSSVSLRLDGLWRWYAGRGLSVLGRATKSLVFMEVLERTFSFAGRDTVGLSATPILSPSSSGSNGLDCCEGECGAKLSFG